MAGQARNGTTNMRNIPGTYSNQFKLLILNFFEEGDIIEAHGFKVIITKGFKDTPYCQRYEYEVEELLEGWELRTALRHFRMLRRYHLV